MKRFLVAFLAFAITITAARAATANDVPLRPKLPADEAAKIFRVMASQKDIAYDYVKDGCYARAYLMSERIKKMGVLPGKIWTFANGNSLSVVTGFRDTD